MTPRKISVIVLALVAILPGLVTAQGFRFEFRGPDRLSGDRGQRVSDRYDCVAVPTPLGGCFDDSQNTAQWVFCGSVEGERVSRVGARSS